MVEDAIRYAVSRGVFVAVAAGNYGRRRQRAEPHRASRRRASTAWWPSAPWGARSQRAYYSTTNSYVEIAAPGGDQRRDGERGRHSAADARPGSAPHLSRRAAAYRAPRADVFAYYYFQGTSMATPHVSALAAMLMQQGITSPAAIEAAMKQFARDLGRAGVDNEYGAGLIQPRATLRGLGLAR